MAYDIMEKHLIISSFFAPAQNGLSDYTTTLYNEIKDKIDVDVVSGLNHKDVALNIGEDWNSFNIFKIFFFVRKKSYTNILVQYVPYMYNRRSGINLFLPILIILLRLFTQAKISIYFHEVNYPFLGTFKSLILFSFHKFQAIVLANFSNNVITSTQLFKKVLMQLCFKEVSVINVGSNIEKVNVSKEEINKYINSLGVSSNPNKVILFGGFHDSKLFELIYPILDELDIETIHMGVKKEDLPKNIEIKNTKNFIFTGYLADNEISMILQSGYPLLCYFIDGLSTRRGSVIAGLCNGTRVISSFTDNTEDLFKEFGSLTLGETSKEGIEKILRGYNFSKKLSHVDEKFFKYFSWKEIGKKILEII